MMNRHWLPAFTILLCFLAAVWVPPADAQSEALAIFNLRPTNIEAMNYSGDILYTLISALEEEKVLEVMPRREMEDVLFQEGLVQSDNPEQVIPAGKALGVKFVLFGDVSKSGSIIRTNLKLMDVRREQVIRKWTHSFPSREAIMQRIPEFADELTAAVLGQPSAAGGAGTAAGAVTQPAVSIDNLRASSKGNEIILTWTFDPAQPITGFHVYRSASGSGPFMFLGGTDKSRFVDTNIQKGQSYFYRVGILRPAGDEIKSDLTAQVKNAGERTPHPPLIMSGDGHIRRIHIKFVPSLQNDQEGFTISAYNVYRKAKGEKQWALLTTVDAKDRSQYELAYEVADTQQLADNATYEYAISSVDSKKRESVPSDAISVRTLAKPVLVLGQDNLLRVNRLRWDAMSNVSGYRLYRREQGQSQWDLIGSNRGADKTQFVDKKDLTDGTVYEYYLTAYDDNGETGASNIVSAKTKDLPKHPEALAAESGMVKSVQLRWTPVDDPDVGGYTIYRGLTPDKLERITQERGYQTNTYLDKGSGFTPLEDGTTYYYAIESFNQYKADGSLSPPVDATTKPRPSRVSDLTATPAADHIAVSWKPGPETDIRNVHLFRSRNGGGWSRLETLAGDRTDYNDADLKPETTYRYQVIVEDQDGLKSDPSESAPVESPLAPEE